MKEKFSLKYACSTNNPEPDPEPNVNVRSEPDLKKIVMDPQHWLVPYPYQLVTESRGRFYEEIWEIFSTPAAFKNPEIWPLTVF
jgi:hypothetical protein